MSRPRKVENYYTDLVPFPDGPPTLLSHHRIVRWCSDSPDFLMMGTVDNAAVHLLLATKKRRHRDRSLVPAKCPELFDIISMIPRRIERLFGSITTHARSDPCVDWTTLIRRHRWQWRICLDGPGLTAVQINGLDELMQRYFF
jgi:hypothetical protein